MSADAGVISVYCFKNTNTDSDLESSSPETFQTGNIIDVVIVSITKATASALMYAQEIFPWSKWREAVLAKLLKWSSHVRFQSCWVILLKLHMPRAIVISWETFVRVIAVLILAQKPTTPFDDAVTTRRLMIQTLHPITNPNPKSLGSCNQEPRIRSHGCES